MKKLMIAAAIAFAAVAANAVTFNWSTLGVSSPKGGAGSTGWLAQLYDSSVTFDVGKALAGTITAAYSTYTVEGTATYPVKVNSTGNNRPDGSEWAAGDAANFYMVIWDNADMKKANNYIVSAVKNQTAPSTGNTFGQSFGNMSATSATAKGSWSGSEWKSIPEPTSALLMLLGVAGLALKRKQK